MNANDLMNALSGIDPKYIDEAAYELHDERTSEKGSRAESRVVDITSRKRIRKFVYIALPSVAAIILIMAVALPAVLRISKSESAAEAPSAAAGTATEATSYDAAAEAPEVDAAAEAPSYDREAEEPSYDETSEPLDVNAFKRADSSYDEAAAEAPAAEAESAGATVEAEAIYEDGILTIRSHTSVPDDISDMQYSLVKLSSDNEEEISKGRLNELTGNIDVTGNDIVLDISDTDLPAGKYRIDIGSLCATFEVR